MNTQIYSEQLFKVNGIDSKLYLIYSANENSMPANRFGTAIIGFEMCLREAAKIGLLNYDEILIEPIEKGSIKSILKFVKKNSLGSTLVTIDLIINLFNNSFQLIDRYGAASFKNPDAKVLAEIKDVKVLDLCSSYDFRYGLQKIAEPIDEVNQKVEIVIGDNTLKITCDNKYKFFVDREQNPILKDLKDGHEVSLDGEITRINKKYNDLGFAYKGFTLSVSPNEKENSIALFHEYLEMDKVTLRGIVSRDNEYEVPKIKVLSVKKYQDLQPNLPIDK
jgi:hypothetical protein